MEIISKPFALDALRPVGPGNVMNGAIEPQPRRWSLGPEDNDYHQPRLPQQPPGEGKGKHRGSGGTGSKGPTRKTDRSGQ